MNGFAYRLERTQFFLFHYHDHIRNIKICCLLELHKAVK